MLPLWDAQAAIVQLEHAGAHVDPSDWSPADVDGEYGPRTRAALRSAQSATGVPITGVLDEATSDALRPFVPAGAWVRPVAGIEHASPGALAELVSIARTFGFPPEWLAACITFESAGTWSPSKRNPVSGAVGLIQFTDTGLAGLATTRAQLARMTDAEQMKWVRAYFAKCTRPGACRTLADVYAVIFAPGYVGRPDDTPVYRAPSQAYTQNKGLDADGDGTITKAEAASGPRLRLAAVSRKPRIYVGDPAHAAPPAPGGGAELATLVLLALAWWGGSS